MAVQDKTQDMGRKMAQGGAGKGEAPTRDKNMMGENAGDATAGTKTGDRTKQQNKAQDKANPNKGDECCGCA